MTPMTPIISWDTGGLFYLSRKKQNTVFSSQKQTCVLWRWEKERYKNQKKNKLDPEKYKHWSRKKMLLHLISFLLHQFDFEFPKNVRNLRKRYWKYLDFWFFLQKSFPRNQFLSKFAKFPKSWSSKSFGKPHPTPWYTTCLKHLPTQSAATHSFRNNFSNHITLLVRKKFCF